MVPYDHPGKRGLGAVADPPHRAVITLEQRPPEWNHLTFRQRHDQDIAGIRRRIQVICVDEAGSFVQPKAGEGDLHGPSQIHATICRQEFTVAAPCRSAVPTLLSQISPPARPERADHPDGTRRIWAVGSVMTSSSHRRHSSHSPGSRRTRRLCNGRL